MITKLTSQQEESIASYQQKWRAINLSIERINRNRVLAVLEDVYNFYAESFTMPEITFFESPYAAFSAELRLATANFNGLSDDEIINQVASLQTICGEGKPRTHLWWDLNTELYPSGLNPQISLEIWKVLDENLTDKVGSRIHTQLWNVLWDWLCERLSSELKDCPDAFGRFYDNFIYPNSEWASYAGLFDYCINELGCQHNQEQWQVYKDLCTECGWWFIPMPIHYIICDRPTKLLLDNYGKLHADGETAIQFADGFGLYAHHGKVDSICFP
ncbi:MAG: hypothetical protein RMY64_23495 [Nostoc sp. DedQUE08]|uniref:DUF6745 domain-containing protein n=1 Tax=unclassified Nostoc TaxID=2593658 RepID=UPI002AD46EB1|nr:MULTISPECIES: hypothetical protein [unclassified Nostoc]MDZ8068557.1 hypothetical protein [Nostoc sp. DedQUE08]MDZ8093347.1 hypothetical protein [Nostoc sp. DedQUE05]